MGMDTDHYAGPHRPSRGPWSTAQFTVVFPGRVLVSFFFHTLQSSRARGRPLALVEYASPATLPPSGEAATIPATARRAARDLTFYDPPGRAGNHERSDLGVGLCSPLISFS